MAPLKAAEQSPSQPLTVDVTNIDGPVEAESGTTEAPLDFEDLVTSGILDLSDDEFGKVSVEEQLPADYVDPLENGTCAFYLEQAQLNRLVAVTSHSVTTNHSTSWLELKLTNKTLRGRTYDRESFSECEISLTWGVKGNLEEAVTIVVTHAELAKAAKAVDTTALMLINMKTERMIIRSSRSGFERPLVCRDRDKFTATPPDHFGGLADFAARLVERDLLSASLRFVKPFADQEAEGDYPVIQARDGSILACRQDAIAQVIHPSLAGLGFHVSSRHARRLLSALEYCDNLVSLIVTSSFLVLQSGRIRFGIELSGKQLPSTSALNTHLEGQDRLLIPRGALLQGFAAQAAANDGWVEIIYAAASKATRCSFRVQDRQEHRISFAVDCTTQPALKQVRVRVNHNALTQAVKLAPAQNACLDFDPKNSLLYITGSLEDVSAETVVVIAMEGPEKKQRKKGFVL